MEAQVQSQLAALQQRALEAEEAKRGLEDKVWKGVVRWQHRSA
jgi:hypothetical protein